MLILVLENSLIVFFLIKERDNFNTAIAENTERHLTNLCQTLTNQLEDVREQLRNSDERYKRLEAEIATRTEKYESIK